MEYIPPAMNETCQFYIFIRDTVDAPVEQEAIINKFKELFVHPDCSHKFEPWSTQIEVCKGCHEKRYLDL